MHRLSLGLAAIALTACAASREPASQRTTPLVDYHQHLVSPAFAPIVKHAERDGAALVRELDAAGIEPASELLERILRDGPDVGVHVIAWCDKPVSLSRRLSSSALREFSLRLLGPMSRDDSFALVDSDAASTIGPSQAILDDHDRAVTQRLRRFTMPSADWMRAVVQDVP